LSGKQAYVVCAGCPESRIDSARIQNFLMENGWNITDKLEDADLVMFRWCGLTKVNVDESLQLIRNIKSRKKEGAQFIVWGCLSKINQEALRTVYSGVTFGEDEADVLDKILEAKKPVAEVVANSVMPILKFHWSGLGGFLGKIEDFQITKHLTNAVKFDWIEVYTFSPANGTTASTMTGQVPEAIKKARFCQLYRKTIFQHPHRKMRQLFCL